MPINNNNVKLTVENKLEPAVELLNILYFQKKSKGTNKIRISRVLGLMMYRGHGAITTYYHINKLIKKGYIWKTVKSRTEKYLEILDTIPFESMLKMVRKNGDIMCSYQTFLMHLKNYPDTAFTRIELEQYMRDKIHEGFTSGNFATWFEKARSKNIIGNTRERNGTQGAYLYTLIPNEPNPTEVPTIHGIYESIIVQLLLKNGPMIWKDLKSNLEEKVGIPLSAHAKVKRAIVNLRLKKYLLVETEKQINSNKYYLNPVYNFG